MSGFSGVNIFRGEYFWGDEHFSGVNIFGGMNMFKRAANSAPHRTLLLYSVQQCLLFCMVQFHSVAMLPPSQMALFWSDLRVFAPRWTWKLASLSRSLGKNTRRSIK